MHDCAFGHGIKDSTRSTSNRKHFLTAFSDDQTTNKTPFIVMDLQPSSFDRARIRTYSNHLTPSDSEDSEARRASLLITSSAARKYPHHRTAHPGHQPPKPAGLHFHLLRAQLESPPTTAPHTPTINPRSPQGFTFNSPEHSSGLALHQNPNLLTFTTHLCAHLISFS